MISPSFWGKNPITKLRVTIGIVLLAGTLLTLITTTTAWWYSLKDYRAIHHTPVIALTADALKGTKERLLKAGFEGYLTKPVKVSDLAGELVRVAKRCDVP